MKRYLALFLCLVLCLSMIPAAAAEDDIEIIPIDELDDFNDTGDDDLIEIIDPELVAKEADEGKMSANSTYPALVLNRKSTATVGEAGDYVYFVFTPARTAEYTFTSFSDSDTYGYLYDSGWNQITSDDDSGDGLNFSISSTLTGGTTYYFGARFYSSSNTGDFDVMLTAGDEAFITLGLNQYATATIYDEGGWMFFRYVPATTGDYTFASYAGDDDPYGYIYDANWNQIAYNDDGGEDFNFSTSATLTSGQTYYFGARYWSSSKTGSFRVLLTKTSSTPQIITHPQARYAAVGQNVTFTVEAVGSDLTYTWYYRTSSSGSWAKYSNTSSPSLTIEGKSYRNGYQYFCIVSNSYGSVSSRAATLTIVSAPAITTHPQSKTAAVGNTVTFSVAATGGGLTYTWYYRTSSSGTWTKYSNSSLTSITLEAKAYRNGYQYFCLVSNAAGSVSSRAATLIVTGDNVKPAITTQPQSVSALAGSTATFTVSAIGSNLTYIWYYRTSASGSWTKFSSTSTPRLTIDAKAYRDGYQYFCQVSNNAGSVSSKAATLTVLSKPAITTHPASVTATAGSDVTFRVSATGGGLTYTWYYRTSSSGSWTKFSNTSSPTLTIEAKSYRNGYQYYCVVSNSQGSVSSRAATLTVTGSSTTYRALLVGEVNFSWETANRNRGDVELIQAALGNVTGPTGGSYRVTCRYDLSRDGIRSAIQSTFSGADSDDVSLFFLATHGVVDVATGPYAGELVTIESPGTTDGYLTLGDLATWLKAVPGKVIVVLGSCGSGAAIIENGTLSFDQTNALDTSAIFADSVIQAFADADEVLAPEWDQPNTGEFRDSKFYVLTAAAHQESSWGHEGSNPYNYFPYYFATGFNTGKPADANGNGTITLVELYNYVYEHALGPYNGSSYQHAQIYPAGSTYALFK